jgi:hypothetical protein
MTLPTQDPKAIALGFSRRLLRGLRVLNTAYGLGVAALLVASLTAPALLFGALGFRVASWGTPAWSARGIMVAGIAGAVVAHRILSGLLQIVETVREGDPFVPDNAARLQALAWWMLGAELLHVLVGGLAQRASTPAQPLDLDWSFSFTPWIAVLLLFVLARVFGEGTRLRDDLAGTV